MALRLQLTAELVGCGLVGHGADLKPVPGTLSAKIGLANDGLIGVEQTRIFLLRIGEVRQGIRLALAGAQLDDVFRIVRSRSVFLPPPRFWSSAPWFWCSSR